MNRAIPASFHGAASRLIVELDGSRTPEVVVRCLLRAYDRLAAATDLPPDEVVLRAEEMALGLLTAGTAGAVARRSIAS